LASSVAGNRPDGPTTMMLSGPTDAGSTLSGSSAVTTALTATPLVPLVGDTFTEAGRIAPPPLPPLPHPAIQPPAKKHIAATTAALDSASIFSQSECTRCNPVCRMLR
jgi:hypothetical protein